MIDAELLKILVCPQCRGELEVDPAHSKLICRAEALAYPIRDGIPILLKDEAQTIEKENKND